MTATPPSPPNALCLGILAYLQAHPEAADSLEGIATWWLPAPAFAATSESVLEALRLLEAEHRIARIELADGRTLYQRVHKTPGPHPKGSR